MSFLILAHAHGSMAQQEVAATVARRIGQPLRRAGMLAHMGLLACLDVLAQEQQSHAGMALSCAGQTALLWHSQQGPQPETEALLAAQQSGDGLLLPFDFLASQPSLLGVHLKPLLPQLQHALFLPGTAHPHEQPWMQALQLASVWLADGRFQRVICAAIDRNLDSNAADSCQYAAISLVGIAQTGLCPDTAVRGSWHAQAACLPALDVVTHADDGLWQMLHDRSRQQMVLQAPGSCLHLRRTLR